MLLLMVDLVGYWLTVLPMNEVTALIESIWYVCDGRRQSQRSIRWHSWDVQRKWYLPMIVCDAFRSNTDEMCKYKYCEGNTDWIFMDADFFVKVDFPPSIAQRMCQAKEKITWRILYYTNSMPKSIGDIFLGRDVVFTRSDRRYSRFLQCEI